MYKITSRLPVLPYVRISPFHLPHTLRPPISLFHQSLSTPLSQLPDIHHPISSHTTHPHHTPHTPLTLTTLLISSPHPIHIPHPAHPQSQYIYIHDAINDYINCKETTIVANELRPRIEEMRQIDSTTGSSGFTIQFSVSGHWSLEPGISNWNPGAIIVPYTYFHQ